ncbi:YhcN/YlaJ family sporulation lipoprotein [Rossellomorea vietnamensis]|uniref:YhcN/YlaJ family sporulation lipoprotein n=2 Tax=Rossellomorea TaxID=2837508 RepID=A0A5D4KLQ5_9BACI|nr:MULTISPECIES: YhcN/YlaJ family sporulation lipoprotein [Rossellomorea]TYR77665.1 YhcN/YlaJ family sporulation lipoprotein [Rossellomorea vietnamensis]TYS77103.1 YhcN/YlaJ family sporulation lipoprotein [Rossellomorea aquimaris]
MKKWLTVISLIILISGCNQQNNQTAYDNQGNGDNPRPINVENSEIQNEQQNESSQKISENLVRIATSVPDVEDATAVVLGKYAFVGIDVNSAVERSEVGTIKYSVAEALKDDPHGARAMIVADPDLYARLQEVGSDIENGRPVQGVLNELSDIAGRLMPELPKNTQQNNPDNAPEQSTDKADGQEERQLEEEQQDQSNNYMNRNQNNNQ